MLMKRAASEQSPSAPIAYADGEEEWVLPNRIASYRDLGLKLCVWKKVLPAEESEGCLVLSDCAKARPHCAITDKHCPTLVLVWYLNQKGWTPVKALCDHATSEITEYDNRQSTRMRPYYLALVSINMCIPLTSHMPSQEPGSYYELLLKGIKAEPGQKHTEYMVLMNEFRRKKAKLPIPLPPPSPPLPLEDDGVILAVDEEPEKPKPKSSGAGRSRRKGAAAKPEPAPLPAPPTPVVVHPPSPIQLSPPTPRSPPGAPSPVGSPRVDVGSSGARGSGDPAPLEDQVICAEPSSEEEARPREKYDFQPGLDGAGILYEVL